jgi:hypothetical protein
MQLVWILLWAVSMGLYLTLWITYVRQERRASCSLVLKSYSKPSRRRWRRAIKGATRASHHWTTLPTDLEIATSEIPTAFVRAEKMRLESSQRMRPLLYMTMAVFFLAEGFGGFAVLRGQYPLLGQLFGSVVMVIFALVAWARQRSRGWQPTHRGVIGRRIADYDMLLRARGH